MFIYTENTKLSNMQIEMFQVNQFAVFGFNLNTQDIIDSHIYVKINYTVLTGALICLECDIIVQNSSLQFIASGLTLSALILKSKRVIQLYNVDIQYRFTCNYSSGIVNLINSDINSFLLQYTILTGYSNYNVQSGYLCSKLSINVLVNITMFTVCINDNMKRVGVMEQQLNVTALEILTCQSVCSTNKYVAYGICSEILNHSILVNYTQLCKEHFIFDSVNNICLCGNGFYLNGSTCVDVNNELSYIIANMKSLDAEIQSSNLELKTLFFNLESDIQANLSNVYDLITETHVLLKEDVRTQNASIHQNLNDLKTNMNSKFQQVFDLEAFSQVQIGSLKNETQSLNNNLTKIINDNELNIKNNFTITNQKIDAVNDLMSVSLSNLTQMSKQINTMNNLMNLSFTNILDTCSKETTLNTQANLIKTQISQLSDKIDHISGTSGCPLNSILANGTCTCSVSGQVINNGACVCQASGAFVVSGVCTCPVGQQIIDDMCQTVIIFNGTSTDSTFQCSSSVYITTFDIQTITNQVTTINNFSRGYVFSSTNIIQNGFIEIQDNVYTILYPLFQQQNSFTNLKIQIGKQNIVLNGGQILTQLTTIQVNQVNIISRDQSKIVINSQVNILTGQLINSSINNLLVNLNISSSGYISLAGAISQQFSLTGYQVQGSYFSSQTVAMICLNISQATVYINQVSFKPSVYDVGNCSSYLISQIYSAIPCTITVSNIVILIGNSSKLQQIGQLSQLNYQFGGIITNINGSNSVITINNVITECYQKFIQESINHYGFLISRSIQSLIILNNLCLYHNISNDRTSIRCIGLIGNNENATLSIQQVSAAISFQTNYSYYLCNFGLVGNNQDSIYCEIFNVKTMMIVSSTGYYIGSIFGQVAVDRLTIQNVSVFNSTLSNAGYIGGFIGHSKQFCQTQCNIEHSIQNSIISQSNISVNGSYVGGFIGRNQVSKFRFMNSKIQFVRITGDSYFGLVFGKDENLEVIYVNCSATSSYIKNSLTSCVEIRSGYGYGC
ncbi:Hypothetical_protein [Hexamita inflata]|uniref:Hypothetical_protein n=1 Tax=Hexamita inflata TaxID=28002 RepID=A0ABP1HH52_9EUKA